ncbi:hypothetical protein F8388_002211 [Cannabis sativa]|uniref:Uncharacterized protein n=1 Tax=Cannabis sativa TaxID=3483 RepID=A0A7J6FU88_CANSA|nr:hypothetical protein F8388_002211 [Cannabis sativa]
MSSPSTAPSLFSFLSVIQDPRTGSSLTVPCAVDPGIVFQGGVEAAAGSCESAATYSEVEGGDGAGAP